MLLDGTKRGFPPERLDARNEPKIKCDRGGFYLYTINENVKVYFEDYYRFLEKTEMTAQKEQDRLIDLIAETPALRSESVCESTATGFLAPNVKSPCDTMRAWMSRACSGASVVRRTSIAASYIFMVVTSLCSRFSIHR